MRLAVIGATGRLGKTIIEQIEKDDRFSIGASLSSKSQEIGAPIDVAIDFSSEEGTRLALTLGVPLVIGTTGLDEETLAAIEEASLKVPIILSPNFSLGMGLLFTLLPKIKGICISIKETHHAFKRDLPGGSARHLASLLKGEVPITSERIGDCPGEHEITFSFEGETLTFKHTAEGRISYARGALEAAAFICHKPPGLYGPDELNEHL